MGEVGDFHAEMTTAGGIELAGTTCEDKERMCARSRAAIKRVPGVVGARFSVGVEGVALDANKGPPKASRLAAALLAALGAEVGDMGSGILTCSSSSSE